MKDFFSRDSQAYANFRPHYPKALLDFIISLCTHHTSAWDCGTGNGQVASVLNEYFDEIIATDISEKQLKAAIQKSNVRYEKTGSICSAMDSSINLITVAQALHWFDLDIFYAEVIRVAAPGAIIAVWTYPACIIDKKIDEIILEFYNITLKDCWDEARTDVDNGYKNLLFPFQEITVPEFHIEVEWNLNQLLGYIKTWSGVNNFIEKNAHDPIPELKNKIEQFWPGHTEKKIIFPLTLKIGRV